MTSKLGYIPDQLDDLANNLQVQQNGNVLYAAPTGFHLVSTIASAATVTLTARQMLGGMLLHDAAGGGTTSTTATAAELVAGFNGVAVNSSCLLVIRNSSGANALTVANGTGVTISGPAGNIAIPANTTAVVLLVFTNVTPGSEAVTMYLIGDNLSHV